MDNKLVWQDRFNIGVDHIDNAHQSLFSNINEMFHLKEQSEKRQWICQEGIRYFKDHAMQHFTDEEIYMTSIDCPKLETHKRLHDDFRDRILLELEKELEDTQYSMDSVNHFLGVCTGWLLAHTLTEDQAITGQNISKWEKLLPKKEHDAMIQTIIQTLYDMFRLDAHVISESYGGEKFGDGVYYRLLYTTKQYEKWEIFLIFEEKLLVKTVGELMGDKTNHLNVMLLNAARYMSQQFVTSIKEQFPFADLDQLWEESLLTYEQFQTAFEIEQPQFSLLFDTGAGYLGFCVLAPHLLQSGLGRPIKSTNAMVEVKKYIDENKSFQRKKILVVDDSSFMLQTMQKLLDTEYEVLLAKTGISAIRCITLNRPDLILLDYEMPVYDGRQVLEMIRSEEDFADIPVFFLTSRADAEIVKKVMFLKPTGYMLKNMKSEDIKKTIDAFFHKNSN